MTTFDHFEDLLDELLPEPLADQRQEAPNFYELEGVTNEHQQATIL